MKLIAGLAFLSLGLAACTSNEPAIGDGVSSTVPATTAISTALAMTAPPSSAQSPTATGTPSPVEVTLDWPAGTMTCAEIAGDFPRGVDDHGIILDQGLVSYYRTGGTDSVEEQSVQFVDDPTCTAEAEAWIFMISGLLDPDSLYRAGQLCDFYSSLQLANPRPANVATVLDRLAAAEQLCR